MESFDVLIIGAGVIGSAVARELTRCKLKIGVLEKNRDVCFETSGRNSAVLHGGFAYDTGTLKARLCVEGNREFDAAARELDVPYKRTGKVLVGNTPEDRERLLQTIETGRVNGASGLSMIDKKRLHELVPAVVGEFAMLSETSGILDPFQYAVALAENACMNGAKFFFDHEVNSLAREENAWTVQTSRGVLRARWVVNAAGLGCGKVSDMLGIKGYRILGSRGTYIVLDKRTGPLLPMPVYPVPSNTYMGIHVTPTVDGNVIVGPDAEYIDDFSYYGVPQKNIDYLAKSASDLWPCIRKSDYIRTYAGILPKWVTEDGVIHDFTIEVRDDLAPNAVNLVGIESPGLTAALPIARHAIGLIAARERLEPNPAFNPRRKGIVRFAEKSPEEQAALVAENPDYGEIICRCEKITRAEILQAVHNPLGTDTMAGVKYRTRSMMGRCQGGYCQMRIAQILEEELGKRPEEVLYARTGSEIFTGKVREA